MGAKNYQALILLLCVSLLSCKKDNPTTHNTAPTQDTGNVYVVCEGVYGSSPDATLYAYRPAEHTVYGDLYQQANGQQLGNVFQSMVRIGGSFFLCINNSGKIVVINSSTWMKQGEISIPYSRYILPISSTKAYVSTMYSNKVYIIDPSSLQVTGTINMPAQNPEGMLLYNNTAYICTWDSLDNKIYKVDVSSNQVSDSITVAGYAPQEVVLDKEQKLWVLSGNLEAGRPAALTRIDPATSQVVASHQFSSTVEPIKPVFNNAGDTLYFIEANFGANHVGDGIYRMGIGDAALPVSPFIPSVTNQYFWALGIDPFTGSIYVGDPKGFTQKGTVYVCTPAGVKTDSFGVGIGPGHFYFN